MGSIGSIGPFSAQFCLYSVNNYRIKLLSWILSIGFPSWFLASVHLQAFGYFLMADGGVALTILLQYWVVPILHWWHEDLALKREIIDR